MSDRELRFNRAAVVAVVALAGAVVESSSGIHHEQRRGFLDRSAEWTNWLNLVKPIQEQASAGDAVTTTVVTAAKRANHSAWQALIVARGS